MKVAVVTLWVLGSFLLTASCGGKVPPVADSGREADGRHCASHQDCASGFCQSNGRCG